MECLAVRTSLPCDSNKARAVRTGPILVQAGKRAQLFFRRNDSAVHSSTQTKTMPSDCRTMFIVADQLLLLTEVGYTNSNSVLDDYDFPITDQRRAHQYVDVVSRRAGDADHALGAQLQDLHDGHDTV